MLNRDYTWRGQADEGFKNPNSGKSHIPSGGTSKTLSKSSVAKLTKSVRTEAASRETGAKRHKKPGRN